MCVQKENKGKWNSFLLLVGLIFLICHIIWFLRYQNSSALSLIKEETLYILTYKPRKVFCLLFWIFTNEYEREIQQIYKC